jgi:hypothetical protein
MSVLVEPKNPSTDWVRGSALTDPMDVHLVREFKKRFSRTQEWLCNPMQDYD